MIKIEIHADRIKGKISPMIYGQMIEHAYCSVHLGLWAQMLDNGGFELDRDKKNDRVAEGWTLMSTSKENIYNASLDDEKPYNAKHSQKISVDKYCCGEIRLLQNNLSVRKGVEYRGSVFLRGKISGNVSFKILSVEKQTWAEQSLGEIDHGEWKKYEFNLPVEGNCINAALVLAIQGEGTLWIDQIQMYPSETYKGHGTRTDIVELYKGLKPAFLRWPGGMYLVWHHWKNGIGSLEDRYYGDGRKLGMRVIHPGEWDPNTFGTDEFIQLCRDIETAPMINVNIKDGLQNTLDWIEYCNGGADTEWGAVRAKNGHPSPYNVE
jgi:alpha-N-arabinofuranosidase